MAADNSTGAAETGGEAAAPSFYDALAAAVLPGIEATIGGIFSGQAALKRAYGRQMREAIEYRCCCVDGCSRVDCSGGGVITR